MQKTQSASDFLKTSFGNILEWYDFSLYGIFTVSISKAFFPSSSAFLSLLMAFLAFSVSFLARPCGSIIFGYIGDKMGKHYSVNLSIWC
ncbi:MAG: MFS transporter, partial [Burkholderiales bacterium]